MEEIGEELRFYFKFKGMVKPVKCKKSDSQPLETKEKLEDIESSPVSYGFNGNEVYASNNS